MAFGRLTCHFDADVAAGKQPQIVVYINNKQGLLEQAMFRQLLDRQVLTLVNPFPAQLVWVDVNKEPEGPSGLSLNQILLPLLLLLSFAMTGALVVPLLLVEEKEKRTLDFLLTSPASLTDITAGKASPRIWVYLGILLGSTLLAFFVAIWALRRQQN